MSDLTVRLVADAVAAERPQVPRAANTQKPADAAQKFEAFVLQTFVQEMMPDEAEGVFGSGIAGDFWKSLMSEKVAEQVAARGGIGIADQLRLGREAPTRFGGGASSGVMEHLSILSGAALTGAAAKSDSGA